MKFSPIATLRKLNPAWFFFIALLLLAGLIVLIIMQKSTITTITKQNQNLEKFLTDTVKVFRNADGSQKATISSLRIINKKELLSLKSKDAEIRRLQQLLSSGQGSRMSTGTAATFTASTSVVTVTNTVVSPGDTVRYRDTTYIYPVYNSSFQLGKWVQGSTKATKDSTIVKFRTYNEYDVVVGSTKRGLFKPSENFADVITHSPYDSINRLRAVQLTLPPQKRLGLGFSAGYGFGVSQGIVRPTIFVGVGVNYNLIQIK